MGEAKRKQRQFLVENPWCAFCGDGASTVDHCPPRCLFDNRHWPEGYVFPACAPCNSSARLDEQVIALLSRLRLEDQFSPHLDKATEGLLRGLVNNQPQVADELLDVSAVQQKRSMRETFGHRGGDYLRHAGWVQISLGPLTNAAIDRTMVKLGKALYYKYIGEVFDGVIFAHHLSGISGRDDSPEFFERMLSFAPHVSDPRRNGKE